MVRTRGGRRSAVRAESTGDSEQNLPSTSSGVRAETAERPQSPPARSRSPLRFFTSEEINEMLLMDNSDSEIDSGESEYGESEGDDDVMIGLPDDEDILQNVAEDVFEAAIPQRVPPAEAPARRGGRVRRTRHVADSTPDIWTTNPPENSPNFTYSQTPGLKQEPPPGSQPITYFTLLFTDTLKELVVSQTNNFADRKKSEETKAKARIKSWKPLTVNEFMVWLGLLFHMGHIGLKKINLYWSTHRLYDFPFFRKAMSRDRFLNILSQLHFVPTTEQKPTDPLYKLRPLLDIFHETMENVVVPTQRLCIDESMILWRGRLVFRVFLKGKRHKYGIKLYMLTEPGGLTLRLIVYTGASDAEVGGQGHVDHVVLKLMGDRLDLGHSLFMDNYYNSVRLAHLLLERRTLVTGTLRVTRKGNPKSIVSQKLKKGELVSSYTDKGVCVMKWRDRRDVLMVSSEFGPHLVDVTDRRNRVHQKPEMVSEYNKFMGGIDHMDQFLAYYPIERKSLKWYRKLAIHLFHLLLTNSYILFKKSNPNSKMSLLDFRHSVVESLVPNSGFPPPRTPTSRSPSLSPSPILPTHIHKPSRTQQTETGRRTCKRCVLCQSNSIRKETSYFCEQCPLQPHLCVDPCFKIFHSSQ